MRKLTFLVAAITIVIALAGPANHATAQPYGPGYGMMGGYGPGWMMGPGYGPGWMMGGGYGPCYGAMRGYGPGWMPGYGMMGGYGPGYMMGSGYGPGWMMRGGYGPGYYGNRGNLNLSTNDVQTYLERTIRNPNLKVGDVKEKDQDIIITADIVTKDKDSLVERLDFNRHTGFYQPEQ
jgi:hypothetical protein